MTIAHNDQGRKLTIAHKDRECRLTFAHKVRIDSGALESSYGQGDEPPPLTEEHIRRIYGSGADDYDRVMDNVYPNMVDRDRIIEVLAPERGDRILEVGVGTGKSLKHYPAGIHLQGTDLTPEMLALAEQKRESFKGASLNLELANTESLPFESASFDRILACLTICVTPNPKAALTELMRLAKPDARVVFYELHVSPDASTAGMQRAMVRGPAMTIGHPPPSEQLPGGVIVWDPCRNLLQLAADLGFIQESVEWYEPRHPVLARCLVSLRKPAGARGGAEPTAATLEDSP